jgi:flagellar motor switch protein FliM
MSDVLSPDEGDELPERIPERETGAPARRNVKRYDFRRPDKFSKDQIRTVAIMHETFARRMTTALSAELGCLAHVHVASVDQLTYEEFIRSIPNPCTLAVLSMSPLRGSALLELDPAIAFSILDRLFGGPGGEAGVNRPLTDLEETITEGVVARILGNLTEAWAGVVDLRPASRKIECNPMFAQVVPPSEMIVLVTLDAEVGGARGMMNLVLPYLTIEPIIGKLSAQYWFSLMRRSPTTKNVHTLLDHIGGFDIGAEVYLEGEKLSLRDLGRLRRGTLVGIPGGPRGEAFLRMGGRTLLRLEERSERAGRPPLYAVSGGVRKEQASDLETAGMQEMVRTALADFGSEIKTALAGITDDIGDLRRKQAEITDQLAFGASEQVPAESGKGAERGRPFSLIRRAEAAHIAGFIHQEHPQLIALVLSYLEPQKASIVLGSLSAEAQPDVARRIACMGRTSPEVLREVERALEKKLSTLSSEDYTAAGGLESVVEILTIAERSTERRVIDALEEKNPELAKEIKRKMFVFEDIVLLRREVVGAVLRRVDPDVLLRAMKATAEDFRAFLWECVPIADREKLKARFEEIGRVRLHDVDEAQQKIVSVVRDMEEAGEIIVERPGETVV